MQGYEKSNSMVDKLKICDAKLQDKDEINSIDVFHQIHFANLKENEKLLSQNIKKYKAYRRKDNANNIIELIISGMMSIYFLKPNLKEDNSLSLMEMLCLIFMVVGKTPHECAELLSISLKSIKTYEQRVHKKLKVKTRATAFYISLVKGYISMVL